MFSGQILHKSFSVMKTRLGKNIKLGDQWFEVAGVLQTKALFTETVGELAARDLNNDVYIPLSTFGKRIPKTNILTSELKQVTVKLGKF